MYVHTLCIEKQFSCWCSIELNRKEQNIARDQMKQFFDAVQIAIFVGDHSRRFNKGFEIHSAAGIGLISSLVSNKRLELLSGGLI